MATKLRSFGLVILCTLLTSTAQIFYKFGIEPLNPFLIIIGLLIYGVAAVILITALKGGELSVLYPVIATSYIWVAFLSFYFFNDSLNIYRWAGIAVIILGISFIGFGSKDSSSAFTEGV